MKIQIVLIVGTLLLLATNAAAVNITGDTTWSGSMTLAEPYNIKNSSTLTIEPGTTITFQGNGKITIYWGATLNANGAKFIGQSNGGINGWDGNLIINNCTFTNMGIPNDRNRIVNLDTEENGQITIQDSRFDNCGSMYLKPTANSKILVANNTFRNQRGNIQLYGDGNKHVVTGNTMDHGGVNFTGQCGGTVTRNVFADGTIGHYTDTPVTLEYNYINKTDKSVTVVREMDGTIRNNVIRGGGWTTGYIGGVIEGNVFIALPVVNRSVNDSTHEHLCGLNDDSIVERNIFVGGSYGAVMAIGSGTASQAIIRNNTFDLRNYGWAYYVHAPNGPVTDGTFINNLLIRTNGAKIEGNYPTCLTTWDYNLWVDLSGDRFDKFTISGKKLGDQGFGRKDLPKSGSYDLDEVVSNPDIDFPFTNQQMLDKSHTIEELLAAYRDAYTPKADSPAINSGMAENVDDTYVTDGQPDIGAIEYTNATSQDVLGPSISNVSPAKDAVEVPLDAVISWTITDSGKGVDATSIGLVVDGVSIPYSHLAIKGSPASYTITYDPDATFSQNTKIPVAVDAEDKAHNSMATYTWSFTTKASASSLPEDDSPSGGCSLFD